MKNEPEVHGSCGNVFADMGMRDAESRLAKAEIARTIRGIIRSRGMTHAEAAGILGITQPEVSSLLRGKLSRISVQRLRKHLRLLADSG